MDYTLTVVYDDGTTLTLGCPTLTDVQNWISHTTMSRDRCGDHHVLFQIVFNHNNKESK